MIFTLPSLHTQFFLIHQVQLMLSISVDMCCPLDGVGISRAAPLLKTNPFSISYQLKQLLRVGWRFLPTPILHDRILSSLRRSFKHCLNFQEFIYRIASLCPENTLPLMSSNISSLTIIPLSLLSWSLTLEWKEFIIDVPLGTGHSAISYPLYFYQCVPLYWSLYTAKGRVSDESCLMY